LSLLRSLAVSSPSASLSPSLSLCPCSLRIIAIFTQQSPLFCRPIIVDRQERRRHRQNIRRVRYNFPAAPNRQIRYLRRATVNGHGRDADTRKLPHLRAQLEAQKLLQQEHRLGIRTVMLFCFCGFALVLGRSSQFVDKLAVRTCARNSPMSNLTIISSLSKFQFSRKLQMQSDRKQLMETETYTCA